MSPQPRTRILIVEDQGMFRTFLEQWLREMPRFILVGAVASGEEGLALLESAQPDVVLLDLQLPGMDGLEFVRAARQIRPHLRTLVLSSLVDPLSFTRVRESGVEGYIEKDASPAELTSALEAIAAGQLSYSTRFRDTLAREGSSSQALGKILSRREQDVLNHVLTGKTSREISELIGLSPRTIEFHRANIMSKLGATNVTELIANARQRGLG
jgi:DNA-binding NarL/FixJ family response regulator